MRHISLQLARAGAWQQARQLLWDLRDWPADASSPYSSALSIGLLLIIALAVNVGQ
jgi:hypothetical protein